MDRLHVFVEGRVQGVGFRYSTYHRAISFGLNGWVRNLPDGRVEAEFEGPRHVLDEMLEWLQVGPRAARVTEVKTTWESGEPKHNGFYLKG
jgi:acylphosphatase